jgi:predicted NBD/HSP70 family sugar kinase
MFVAIDLGGTNTRVMTFEAPAPTQFAQVATYPTPQKYAEQRSHLVEILHQLGLSRIQGVALSIGVQLTRDGLAIDQTYTMPDYAGKPLVAELTGVVKCPVRAANDNVCAVLVETHFGSLQAYERAAYLTVSTGTGAGVCLRQQNAGVAFLSQVGHQMIDAKSGLRCTCGQVGCVQTITGAQWIARRFGKPAADITDDSFWQEVTQTLAVTIINLARVTRVDAVSVGGGIGFNNPYLRAHLADTVRAAGPSVRVDITWPHFGEAAPMQGAALLLSGKIDVTILH